MITTRCSHYGFDYNRKRFFLSDHGLVATYRLHETVRISFDFALNDHTDRHAAVEQLIQEEQSRCSSRGDRKA